MGPLFVCSCQSKLLFLTTKLLAYLPCKSEGQIGPKVMLHLNKGVVWADWPILAFPVTSRALTQDLQPFGGGGTISSVVDSSYSLYGVC